jgi:uncharacterized membrane protein YpjA
VQTGLSLSILVPDVPFAKFFLELVVAAVVYRSTSEAMLLAFRNSDSRFFSFLMIVVG